MHMRVMRQRGTPRVQHRHEADAGAQMPARGRDLERGLRRRPEQQIVDHRLVGVGDVGDRAGQRVHDMEVRNREQLGLALGQPLACRCPLALRTMPVAAAVVADDGVPHAPFSQRATWPPSAAVRQRSIAVITFIWPRLMCPALARRHAGPWSRKMSATSRAGRSTILGRYADGSPWPRRPGLLPGFWAGDLGSFLSSSSGLTTPEIMPVATRA